MFFLFFFMVLIFAIWIYVQYLIAKLFEQLSFDKGYTEHAHAFILCFLLNIVGYIYVAAMPTLNSPKKEGEYSRTKVQTPTSPAGNDPTTKNDEKAVFDEREEIYNQALIKMQRGAGYNTARFYKEAILLFNQITEYKDVPTLIAKCEKKIQELSNK